MTLSHMKNSMRLTGVFIFLLMTVSACQYAGVQQQGKDLSAPTKNLATLTLSPVNTTTVEAQIDLDGSSELSDGKNFDEKMDGGELVETTPDITVTALPAGEIIDSGAEKTEICTQPQGHIEVFNFDEEFEAPFRFRVYTPPCYDDAYDAGYPVLYLLHGQGFDDDQWDRLGADETATEMILAGKAAPFIIVMPWEEFNLMDSWESNFDDLLLDDLIPWVDTHYATCNLRECRAIGGISRGAAWAIRLGLMDWETFGSLGAHSFPPFKNDIYRLPEWLMQFPADQRPRIYVDIGSYDRYLKAANEFQMAFVNYRLPYEWHMFDGMHNEAYWESHIADYLEWYVKPWNERAGLRCTP